MIFGNKKQKGQRTLKEYDGQKVKTARRKTNSARTKETHYFSRFMFYFLILTFFGTAGYLLFFSGFLTISRIEIQGNEIVKSEDIQKIINSKLEGKYFKFLDRNNLILLNSRAVKNELLGDFKIISRVEAKKNFPDGIKISILERVPQLIIKSEEKEWVIDENGKIFDEAEGELSYLGNKSLPVVIDEGNKGFAPGNSVMDERYLFFISDFRKKAADEMGIEFENEIQIPNISSGEITMKTRDGWRILLDENLGSVKEKEMLQAVFNNKIEKEKRPDLEYVDLRIANKVFYKFKDATPEETANEAADKAAQDSANTAPTPLANTSKKDDNKKKNRMKKNIISMTVVIKMIN